MVHTFYFFARKPSLSREAFDHYYIALHTKAGKRIKAMQAYIQNHRIPSLGGDSPYDAMSELWSEQPRREWAEQNPAYPADEENFIDLGRTAYLSATDRVIVNSDARRSGMIQGLFQLRRRLGMSPEDFRGYWLELHAPIVRTLPGLLHYQQCSVLEEIYGPAGMCDPRWDGVEEVWFEDYAAARRAIDSPEYRRSFLPDFANFSEHPWHFFAETALLMSPGKSVDEVRREIDARSQQPWRD
ncbi:MAG TPA: EthD family reductase [Candidatus Binataceae bacterium]|jgi:uncharacterized protein (TIGR02118 family)|nr:EthD family reductase [Candidatus Binataceae bacterium]